MRIYFLSERAAGLKLDGAYIGVIDGFERFVNIESGSKILAEVFPSGDFLPLHFFIDEEFFKSPPDFADVYLMGNDVAVYLSRFIPRIQKLKVVAQISFAGGLYTLILNGGRVYLSSDNGVCNLTELPRSFENATLSEKSVGGYPLLFIEGEGCLAIFSAEGKQIFLNPAESFDVGDKLVVTVNFSTCAQNKATCTFACDGTKLTLEGSVTKEYAPTDDKILHFGFFESVLTRGDFAKYLSDDIKGNAAALPSFFGEFCEVTVPHKRFFEEHGDLNAAGLVYPVKSNLFRIRYFAAEIAGGKICNVFEVE